MYKYEFVRIKLRGFLGKKPTQNYKEIVEQYAIDGWRFVQIFAPATAARVGEASYFELIFEKEI